LAIGLAKPNSISPARLLAFEVLRRVEDGAYASVLLASREAELEPLDRALCHELVMGVLRRQLWLDRLIEFYAKRKVSGLDEAVRLALRLGLYQLRFLSRIPQSAAVNESVNLVYAARLRSAGGLVNAVLRRAAREPDVDPVLTITDPGERLAVATSHPVWLIERWLKAFGRSEAEAFAYANNEPAPVAFRVVSNRAQESEVCEQLRQAGATLVPSRIAPGAWRVTGVGSLLSQLVAKGWVYVQDEGSQLVSAALGAKPGELVLDLCAAPGSKTSQIADATGDAALIVASDLHLHRLRTAVQTAQLHGLTNIRCVVLDGLASLPLRDRAFDRVLVDAPCSGTGTLRRNPEIRWRITPADIQDLSERQNQLLLTASQAVKPGGRLVYSTCSVEPDENEAVAQTFLENNADFKGAELSLDAPLITSSGGARTWPQRDGTDGFFIRAFERKRE
jgi:16S rRNA (cytosine967-C5)-methyltransferase